jgi:hypothetical protein
MTFAVMSLAGTNAVSEPPKIKETVPVERPFTDYLYAHCRETIHNRRSQCRARKTPKKQINEQRLRSRSN